MRTLGLNNPVYAQKGLLTSLGASGREMCIIAL